jgi:hypothetical protein
MLGVMPEPPPFHLALPVDDLAAARAFYGDLLACAEGRSSARWIDYDFFGHQLTVHLVPGARSGAERARAPVDGDAVPLPHFGAVLPWEAWHELADRLRGANVEFVIEPHVRFRGEPGEQATLFLRDPSGNALEFKSFQDPEGLFRR